MSKVAVVYWSGTGNTEAMAMAVAEGVKNKGAEVSVLTAGEFSAAQMSAFNAVAFGCPSMGAEQLEESEFEPMFSDCEGEMGRFAERISLCLVPTAGATANGCATGSLDATKMEPIWCAAA